MEIVIEMHTLVDDINLVQDRHASKKQKIQKLVGQEVGREIF